nr:NADH dehydrogenase subunit 5 [Heterochaerus australis]
MVKDLSYFLFKAPSLLIPLSIFFWGILNSYLEEKSLGVFFSGFMESGFYLNNFSSYFIPFCSCIGSMVILFSVYYMKSEEISSFSFCLTGFIIFMLLLTSSMNFISMFLGWEGVGIFSFLLIGWFSSRFWASEGSKKAVLFNRISDFFFLFIIVVEMGNPMWSFSIDSSFKSVGLFPLFLLAISFIMSTMGKSAQFLFHPWLTSAMEGPTPVSSLLHSSTMVVAGVYLFLFIQSFLFSGSWSLTLSIIGFSACITLLSSSAWALSQEDVKKVIALSTTSQLSFMMLLIYLNLVELAFLHMVLHGFFKALIFMGSGVAIHSGSNSQDFRSTGLHLSQKSLFLCFMVGNMGLMGFPFMGAFFSKHSFISEMVNQLSGSLFLFMLIFFSFSMTMGYSLKLFFSMKSGGLKLPLKNSGEELKTLLPIKILTLCSLTGGSVMLFESFHSTSHLISLESVGKWNFYFLGFLSLMFIYLFKHSSFSLSYFFSSFSSLTFFAKGKMMKFSGEVGLEKMNLLKALKKSFYVPIYRIFLFQEEKFFSTNFFSIFFSFFLVGFLVNIL